MSKILVVDVGNTHTTFGVYMEKKLCHHWRISTSSRRTPDEWGFMIGSLLAQQNIKREELKRVVISCVVPPVLDALEFLFQYDFHLSFLVVGPGIRTGLAVRAEAKEVGADRIVNAVAGSSLYGGDLIIIDFGTATTFCAVTSRREYLGGAIAPGVGIALEALYEKTAKLPRIGVEVSERCIGRNTVEAMHAGIFFGYIGLGREIVKKMKEEFSQDARVIGTGGWGIFLHKYCDFIDIFNPVLTLEGLRIIHELNEP
ncbi:MAG: type III pantothenate kinase [Candidatus Caldatribacteriaceae bacterium]